MMARKVLVAMSGGVDSSVAAAMLVSQGWEVLGVTLKLWPAVAPDGSLGSPAAVEEARRSAGHLGIPHQVLDVSEDFRRHVVEPFIADYRRGRTPNPCVLCNERIKFGVLFSLASELAASRLATGHYARVGTDPEAGIYRLLRARDADKDQTYVLYRLGQGELERVVWPLGGLKKTEVRDLARSLGWRLADKPESQEICFVGECGYRQFLRAAIPDALREGPIYHIRGELLGYHRGLPLYTVGQRRGLGLAWPQPLYVVRLDPERNAVVVGSRDDLACGGLVATRVNFIPFSELPGPLQVTVKVRYGRDEYPALIRPVPAPCGYAGPAVAAVFERPVRAVAPGQAAVFYRGEEVIGGGTIHSALDANGKSMEGAEQGHPDRGEVDVADGG
ncbi:MAG: tRNA 2-thiouridine(34) synthase MnmA [bacterium]|nr:tRNA 2-thiouridine(34) synthase MnmA [bacterium]